MDCPSLDLSFCDAFSYPQEVRQHWIRIGKEIVETINDVTAIAVLGSTSRGELTYQQSDGYFRLYSDYELLVLTPTSPSKAEKADLQSRVDALYEEFQLPGPIFDIDITINTHREMLFKKWFDRTLFVYDTMATSHSLYGENIRNYLGNVSVDEIDRGYLKNLVPTRLCNQTYLIPEKVISGNPSDFEHSVYLYSLARNCLEIPTIILPHYGFYEGTFRNRIMKLKGVDCGYLSSGYFIDILEECMSVKDDLVFSYPDWKYYSAFLQGYSSLADWILNQNSTREPGDTLDLIDRLCSANVRVQSQGIIPFKRRIEQRLQYTLGAIQMTNCKRFFKWFFANKRLLWIGVFLGLHGWLYSLLHPGKTKQVLGHEPHVFRHYVIQKLEVMFNELDINRGIEIPTTPSEKAWIELREKATTLYAQMEPGKSPQSIRKAMTWTDDEGYK